MDNIDTYNKKDFALKFLIIILLCFAFFKFFYRTAQIGIAGLRAYEYFDFQQLLFPAYLIRKGIDYTDNDKQKLFLGDASYITRPPYKDEGFFLHKFPVLYSIMIPLTFLPYKIGSTLWLCIQLILIFVSAIWLINFLNLKDPIALTIAILIFTNYNSILRVFELGHFDTIILLCFIAILYFAYYKRDILAGIFLGINFLFLLTPLIFIVYFILRRRFLIVITSFVTIIILILLPLLYLPSETIVNQFKMLYNHIGSFGFSSWWGNHSFGSFIARLVSDRPFPNVILQTTQRMLGVIQTLFSAFIVFIIAFICIKRKEQDIKLEFGLTITGMLLISHFVTELHFLFLLIPYLVLLPYILEKRSKYLAVFYVISLMLLGMEYTGQGIDIIMYGPLSLIYGSKLYGIILLYGILVQHSSSRFIYKNFEP
ncbi:MAG: glycosyltransferase family 87 protein [Candidatus Hydrogenedentota bacterium]